MRSHSPKDLEEAAADALSFWEAAAVFLVLLLFVVLTSYKLTSPALIWDCLLDEYRAAEWAQAFRVSGRFPSEFFGGYGVYHGRLTSYLMTPLFFVFGPHYALVKSWPVFFGFLTCVLTWLLTRKAFGRLIAFMALLLLAVHPSFIGGVRVGNMHASYMLVFSIGSMYFLHKWWMCAGGWSGVVGLLVAALGVGTRLWFSWYIIALLAVVSVFRREVKERLSLEGCPWRTATKGLLVFAGGLFPIFWFEVAQGFPSFRHFLSAYRNGPSEGMSLLQNVWGISAGLHGMLGGQWIGKVQFQGISFPGNDLYLWMFAASIAFAVYAFFKRPRTAFSKSWLALALLPLFMVAQGLVGPASRDFSVLVHYLFIIYPFPQILLAVGFGYWFFRFRNSRLILLVAVCFVAVFLGEVRSLAFYMHQVRSMGGLRSYSDATRGLCRWLDRHSGEADVVAVSYHHLMANLFFWSPQLPLRTLETFSPDLYAVHKEREQVLSWQEALRSDYYRTRPHVALSQAVAPLSDPEKDFFPRWETECVTQGYRNIYLVRYNYHQELETPVDLVLYWVAQRNKRLRLKARFLDADGMPMYEVYLLTLDDSGEESAPVSGSV